MSCLERMALFEALHARPGAPIRQHVEGHVAQCAACRTDYESMAVAKEALSSQGTIHAATPCVSEAMLAAYLNRALPPDIERDVEAHVAACSDCLGDLVAAQEAQRDVSSGVVPRALVARVEALRTTSSVLRAQKTARSMARTLRRRRRERMAFWPVAVAAAIMAAFIGLVVVRHMSSSPHDSGVAQRDQVPRIERVPEPEVVPNLRPEKRRPDSLQPLPPAPEVIRPREDVPKPALPPVPPSDGPGPGPTPEPAQPTRAERRYVDVQVAAVRGRLKIDGSSVDGSQPVSRSAVLTTDARYGASFDAEGEFTVFMRPSTVVRMEKLTSGDVEVQIESGEALFDVKKRQAPFVVRSPHANASVLGTTFAVEVAGKVTVLTVVEGKISFGNEKGNVTVHANQRCTVHAGERPRQPSATGRAAAEWAKRPELAREAPVGPWMESVAGTNRKLPGVVISAPYASWEVDSGVLARQVSDVLEVGLFLGYRHRDKAQKIWINVDRGTEGKVNDDGSLGAARASDRAKQAYEEYLARVRDAAGVGPKGSLPLIVTLRNHSEKLPTGDELAVCEVAWSGFKRQSIEQASKLYAQLVERHKPTTVIDFRWDELDETYEHKGQKVRFKFTEGDAKEAGWLTTPVCRKGIAFFLPPSYDPRDEAYVRIFAELVEFLYRS